MLWWYSILKIWNTLNSLYLECFERRMHHCRCTMNLSTFETLPFSLVVVHVDRQAKMKTDTLLYQAQAVCQSMHSPIGKVSGGGK